MMWRLADTVAAEDRTKRQERKDEHEFRRRLMKFGGDGLRLSTVCKWRRLLVAVHEPCWQILGLPETWTRQYHKMKSALPCSPSSRSREQASKNRHSNRPETIFGSCVVRHSSVLSAFPLDFDVLLITVYMDDLAS
jgi:hypothetical protein